MYKCNECSFNTWEKKKFTLHKRKHTGKLYSCFKCDYSTVTQGWLNKHMFIHGDIPFKCNKCVFATTTVGEFKRHNLTHTKRPFKCNLCNFAGVQKSSLTLHMRSHNRNRFKCPTCSYIGASKSKWLEHLKVHEEIPPKSNEKSPFPLKENQVLLMLNGYVLLLGEQSHSQNVKMEHVDNKEETTVNANISVKKENVIENGSLVFIKEEYSDVKMEPNEEES